MQAEKKKSRVLVTGAGGPSGKAAIAALKACGFHVVAADMQQVAHEADEFVQVCAALAPEFLPALKALLKDYQIDWLFPTVAEELAIVAQQADEMRKGGVAVFISAPEAVAICQDKWLTAEALKHRGVAVPAGALGNEGDAVVRALGFPCVSRPRVGRGGRGVVVHDAPGVAPAVSDPIWQVFMDGVEYDVLMVRSPDAPHAILMQQVFEKTALKEGRVGNAVGVMPVQADDVASLATQAASALGLVGPLDMDIRRDAEGKPRLLEINARIGAHALKAPAVFDVLVELFRQGHRG